MGLWLIGVPSAPLWGMLAMILRFVPYIGAVISAVFPLILSAAVGSDWGMVHLDGCAVRELSNRSSATSSSRCSMVRVQGFPRSP